MLVIVFFGNLTPDVEDLRYQHTYHPIPIETKCPALARVLDTVSSGMFGGDGVYEPWVSPELTRKDCVDIVSRQVAQYHSPGRFLHLDRRFRRM